MSKGSVLIVDDELLNREMVGRMMEALGYEVLSAECGEIALGIFKANPDITILITDLNMAKMDGYELIREIKKIKKDVKVILMSGCDVAFVPEGARFLKKPFKYEELRVTVELTEKKKSDDIGDDSEAFVDSIDNYFWALENDERAKKVINTVKNIMEDGGKKKKNLIRFLHAFFSQAYQYYDVFKKRMHEEGLFDLMDEIDETSGRELVEIV